MRLRRCLERSTRRNLLAIAKQRDVEFDYHWSKDKLVNRLCDELAKPDNISRALASLSQGERTVLQYLAAGEGQMAWDAFTKRFGCIRSYKPWHEGAQKPWLNPISPAERLFYLGLVFKVTIEERAREFILIPEDIRPSLPKPGETPPALLEAVPEPSVVEEQSIIRDVFTLLSFLNRERVEPIWGRWLTLNQMRHLNSYLMVKEDLRKVRSERQTGGRLLFIHYLCERAGLMALTGSHLKPTPKAYGWLKLNPFEKVETLWDAWREESEGSRELWKRYHLVGWKNEDPLALLNYLLTHLSQCPPGQWFRLDSLLQALGGTDVRFPAFEKRREQFVVDAITCHLYWMGAAALGYNEEGKLMSFQLTPLGGQLLGLPCEEEMAEGRQEAFSVTSDLRIVIPYQVDLSFLFQVEEWAVLQSGGRERTYCLTRESVGRALERGRRMERFLSLLEKGSRDGLPLKMVERLKEWEEEYGRVHIRQVILLETVERKILEELFASRRIRRHLGETISPRDAVVRGKVRPLVEDLRKEGYLPEVDVVEGAAGERRGELSPGEAIYLFIAAAVYQELAHLLDLSIKTPYSVLEEAEAHLDRVERERASRVVQVTVERLKRALGKGSEAEPTLARPIPSFPTEELLSRLQDAIESQTVAHIEYYTAGRGKFTQRKIDPYRVEWRDDVPYLIAYCHLRRDERVFRLDRIKSLELLDASS